MRNQNQGERPEKPTELSKGEYTKYKSSETPSPSIFKGKRGFSELPQSVRVHICREAVEGLRPMIRCMLASDEDTLSDKIISRGLEFYWRFYQLYRPLTLPWLYRRLDVEVDRVMVVVDKWLENNPPTSGRFSEKRTESANKYLKRSGLLYENLRAPAAKKEEEDDKRAFLWYLNPYNVLGREVQEALRRIDCWKENGPPNAKILRTDPLALIPFLCYRVCRRPLVLGEKSRYARSYLVNEGFKSWELHTRTPEKLTRSSSKGFAIYKTSKILLSSVLKEKRVLSKLPRSVRSLFCKKAIEGLVPTIRSMTASEERQHDKTKTSDTRQSQ